LATEFSKYAIKRNQKSKNAQFQKLIFLLRDWQNKQEYEFGEIGGIEYLTNVLEIKDSQPAPLKSVRKYIKKSFEKTSCFLLPYPGTVVATNKHYDGRRSEFDPEFDEYLKKFLELTLNSEKLVAKKIFGNKVTGFEFSKYLLVYLEAFKSNDLPKVETIHRMIVKKQYDIMITEAIDQYKLNLKAIDYNAQDIVAELEKNHEDSLKIALDFFEKKKKFGSASDEDFYENQLKSQMQENFLIWKEKHLKTYERIKKIEEEALRELEVIKERAKNDLEMQKKIIKEETVLMQQKQLENQKKQEAELQRIKEEATAEITQMREENEAQMEEIHRNNVLMKRLLNQKNAELRKAAEEAFKKQQQEIALKQAQMEEEFQQMEVKRKEDLSHMLEELKVEFENKKMDLNHKLKIEELRFKTKQELLNIEHNTKLKELKIREEELAEDKKEKQRLLNKIREEQERIQSETLSKLGVHSI
jgi:Guanylate-binding protein, N-terminal domain